MKQCYHCKEDVKKEATLCPHCGGKLGADFWIDGLKATFFLAVIGYFLVQTVFS